ncbi:MAG: CotH kinase family protein, partial [Clostridia bacterium]
MKKAFTAFLILISLTLMYGCESSYFYGPDSYYSDAEWNGGNSVLNGKPFYEDKTIYNNDKDGDVTCLYLTVREGKDLALKKSYSFGYLKSYTDSDITAGEEPFCNVLMSVGTTDKSTIPGNFGYLETVTNATLTVKGDTEKIKQRSFQLKLFDRAGLWNGMKTINLMKNTNDISRVKEKLCFDVVEKINNISGFRTGFVRLFTRDTTETDTNLLWVDNGIYTFIEQPNKAYLTSRGYDSSGYLYRSKDFNFKTNPALIDVGDPKYNATDFEKILSIRAGKNHTSLINTIKNVNSPDVDINTLMGLSFNEENMLTYMAINILFANCRAYNDDYLLYAPSDSMTWYFLCEGFRDVFNCYDPENKIPLHIMSYSFLQNNLLFSKYLKTPANRIKLSKKLDE